MFNRNKNAYSNFVVVYFLLKNEKCDKYASIYPLTMFFYYYLCAENYKNVNFFFSGPNPK